LRGLDVFSLYGFFAPVQLVCIGFGESYLQRFVTAFLPDFLCQNLIVFASSKIASAISTEVSRTVAQDFTLWFAITFSCWGVAEGCAGKRVA
jgi:hypothetical protein